MRRTERILLGACFWLVGCGAAADFDLGVAAFEVQPHLAYLWTHVVPGVAGATVEVRVEVAADAAFQQLVDQQTAVASTERDYTVRVAVRRLESGTPYWYRFHAEGPGGVITSEIGRFRTPPMPEEKVSLRFVISGDSNAGFTRNRGLSFYVLSAAAAENADFFIYFGDTVYADSGVIAGGGAAVTLDEYREVHRITRADPHLQQLLASTATYTGWDDHEVVNDYAGETVDPDRFAAGARAFFEYLPPGGRRAEAETRTHRTLRYGSEVEFFFLDGRQFRSAEQFCNETLPDGPETGETLFSPFTRDEEIAQMILPPSLLAAAAALLLPSDPDCVENLLEDPSREYLGAEQLDELKQALLDSEATWQIIINNTPITNLLFLPYDRWEGYEAAREDLLSFIETNLDPSRVLVLTTDFHTNLALRHRGLTELIVGPIATGTFGSTVNALRPPGVTEAQLFLFLNLILLQANEPFLRAEHDALSYAVVDVLDDGNGGSSIHVSVKGDRDYALGTNDPGAVKEIFFFDLP